MPIDISVAEASFRRLRLGGGAEIESGIIQPRAVAQFTHTNLFNELIRLDAQATFGGAIVDAIQSNQLEWVGSVGGMSWLLEKNPACGRTLGMTM